MKEYSLIFRMDLTTPELQPSQELLDGYMVNWMAWLDGIAAESKLADSGNHFTKKGWVVRRSGVLRAPYVSANESVAGYVTILAADDDDALRIAAACPILGGDRTSVEVRETGSPGTA